jgi:hypothetical protein
MTIAFSKIRPAIFLWLAFCYMSFCIEGQLAYQLFTQAQMADLTGLHIFFLYLITLLRQLKTTDLILLKCSSIKIWQNYCYMFREKGTALKNHMRHIPAPATRKPILIS